MEGEGGRGCQAAVSWPLGPNPSPGLAQAPLAKAVGPGFGPSPSAKNSGWLRGKPLGWGREEQPQPGVRRSQARQEMPAALSPRGGSGQQAEPLGKSRTAPSDLRGAGVPRLPRGGLPLTPAATPSWAWAGPRCGHQEGHQEGGEGSSAPSVSAPGDGLTRSTCQFPLFTFPARTVSRRSPRACSAEPGMFRSCSRGACWSQR